MNSDLNTMLPDKTDRPSLNPKIIEKLVLQGDISKLGPAEKIDYYNSLCHSLGMNPATQPFGYMNLKGKETLYAKKDAAEQLRFIHGVSIDIKDRQVLGDVYVVTASAKLPSGRVDESTGAVSVGGLKGEMKANAFMKAETKAKRRVTLSICGLGMIDETEVKDIPQAETIDHEDVKKKKAAAEIAAARKELGEEVKRIQIDAAYMKEYLKEVVGADSSQQLNIKQIRQLTEDLKDGTVLQFFANDRKK